jgi:hypothetical protein
LAVGRGEDDPSDLSYEPKAEEEEEQEEYDEWTGSNITEGGGEEYEEEEWTGVAAS